MSENTITDEQFDQAWFNVMLPARVHPALPAPPTEKEHERLTVFTYNVYIDRVKGNKWQATIKPLGSDKVVYRSVPWSERVHAVHSAFRQITSGRILCKLEADNA